MVKNNLTMFEKDHNIVWGLSCLGGGVWSQSTFLIISAKYSKKRKKK